MSSDRINNNNGKSGNIQDKESSGGSDYDSDFVIELGSTSTIIYIYDSDDEDFKSDMSDYELVYHQIGMGNSKMVAKWVKKEDPGKRTRQTPRMTTGGPAPKKQMIGRKIQDKESDKEKKDPPNLTSNDDTKAPPAGDN